MKTGHRPTRWLLFEEVVLKFRFGFKDLVLGKGMYLALFYFDGEIIVEYYCFSREFILLNPSCLYFCSQIYTKFSILDKYHLKTSISF